MNDLINKPYAEITFKEFKSILSDAIEYYGSVTTFGRLCKINPATIYNWLRCTTAMKVNTKSVVTVCEFLKLKVPPPKRMRYSRLASLQTAQLISGYCTVTKALTGGAYLRSGDNFYCLKNERIWVKRPKKDWVILHMPISKFYSQKFRVIP